MNEPCKAAIILAEFGFKVVKYERNNPNLVKPVPLYKLWHNDQYLGAGYNSSSLNNLLKIYLIGITKDNIKQIIREMEYYLNPHSMVPKNTLLNWIKSLEY